MLEGKFSLYLTQLRSVLLDGDKMQHFAATFANLVGIVTASADKTRFLHSHIINLDAF